AMSVMLIYILFLPCALPVDRQHKPDESSQSLSFLPVPADRGLPAACPGSWAGALAVGGIPLFERAGRAGARANPGGAHRLSGAEPWAWRQWCPGPLWWLADGPVSHGGFIGPGAGGCFLAGGCGRHRRWG